MLLRMLWGSFKALRVLADFSGSILWGLGLVWCSSLVVGSCWVCEGVVCRQGVADTGVLYQWERAASSGSMNPSS